MDYQEAIEALQFEGGIEITGKPRRVAEFFDAIDVAISAMQELQAIHNNGISLERLKDIDFRKQVVGHINYMDYMDIKDELEEYKQIGTIEEVLDAVEKQKKKKPRAITNRCYVCPHCGLVASLKIKHNYCYACGQHIDWSEVED